MSVEQLAGVAAIITAFFSGLGVCLRLLLQVTRQMKENGHQIQRTAKIMDGSTKVPPEDNSNG